MVKERKDYGMEDDNPSTECQKKQSSGIMKISNGARLTTYKIMLNHFVHFRLNFLSTRISVSLDYELKKQIQLSS